MFLVNLIFWEASKRQMAVTDAVHLMVQLVKLFLVRLAQYVKLPCLSRLLSSTFVDVALHVVLIQFTDSPAVT